MGSQNKQLQYKNVRFLGEDADVVEKMKNKQPCSLGCPTFLPTKTQCKMTETTIFTVFFHGFLLISISFSDTLLQQLQARGISTALPRLQSTFVWTQDLVSGGLGLT